MLLLTKALRALTWPGALLTKFTCVYLRLPAAHPNRLFMHRSLRVAE